MHLLKTLSISAFSVIALVGCKTSQPLSKISSPITYSINHSIAEDSTLVRYYLPFKAKMESEMNRIIGKSDLFLTKDRASSETLVGNFFADALLQIGKEIDPSVQISFATKGGIRSEIKQGNITVGDIFQVMPFENAITILELKGTDLVILANYIAQTGGQPIAGFTIDINADKAENIKINGVGLDVSKTYKLVTYDYLANGGDYTVGLTNAIQRKDTPLRVREGLIQYVEGLTKEGKTINTKLDGRIKVIK